MTYFVTGATGFIGGAVARQLVAAGHRVVALVRSPAGATGLWAAGLHVAMGDIGDPDSVRAAMMGADGVFHIAGWYKVGVRDRSLAYHINVDGTRNVLKAARDLGIPKIVYTSTLAVFSDTHGVLVDESYYHAGPFLSEYDRTKWLAHYEVALPMAAKGLPLVIVLPGMVYGPGDTSAFHDTLIRYLNRKLPMSPSGAAFCWAHIDDTARGHILAMERGAAGESYIIAGPPHTLVETLEVAERITGIPAPRLHPSPRVVSAIASVMGVVERVVSLPPEFSSETLRVLAGATYQGSNAKARRDLGYSPRPLEEGLRETLVYEMGRLGLRPAPP